MSNLRLQKRLTSSIRKCGKKKVWLDPNETSVIANANSRAQIRVLLKDGFIFCKPTRIHSKYRIRKDKIARLKGRHCGFGKRKGTRNARTSRKELWVRRMQILRRLLRRFRENKKIDKHLHMKLYQKVKGNVFKNKRVLAEFIFKKYAENARLKCLRDEAEAHRTRFRESKKRRLERIAAKKEQLKIQEIK
ncbi:60S ribosomal protein L19-like [Coccinella septempunctata]|uniref:60S ribosomal protein L19-like n=1 Tax=Coccinella septempunctata TaxID=41139 RepID=UPI001D07DED9|nr:60S ribosomal protein L19-like [Coccinella septempunctata]